MPASSIPAGVARSSSGEPLPRNKRPLVGGRHVAGGPVRRAADRPAARIGHDDEPRQVLGDAAQPVAEPRAERRACR